MLHFTFFFTCKKAGPKKVPLSFAKQVASNRVR